MGAFAASTCRRLTWSSQAGLEQDSVWHRERVPNEHQTALAPVRTATTLQHRAQQRVGADMWQLRCIAVALLLRGMLVAVCAAETGGDGSVPGSAAITFTVLLPDPPPESIACNRSNTTHWHTGCNAMETVANLWVLEAIEFVAMEKHGGRIEAGNLSIPISVNTVEGQPSTEASLVASAITTQPHHDDASSPFCWSGGDGNATSPPARNLLTIGVLSHRQFEVTRPLLENLRHAFITISSPSLESTTPNRQFPSPDVLPSYPLAEAISRIMEAFRWTAVIVVTSDSEDAREDRFAYNLCQELASRNICVVHQAAYDHRNDNSVRQVVNDVHSFVAVRAVILLTGPTAAKTLFNRIKEQNISSDGTLQKKIWIGVEPWASSSFVFDPELEELAPGAILIRDSFPSCLQQYSTEMQGQFVSHLAGLTAQSIRNRGHVPSLCLAWQEYLNCSLRCPASTGVSSNKDRPLCDEPATLVAHNIAENAAEVSAKILLALNGALVSMTRILSDYDQQSETLRSNSSAGEAFSEFATPERIEESLRLFSVTADSTNCRMFTSSLRMATSGYEVSSIINGTRVKWASWYSHGLLVTANAVPTDHWSRISQSTEPTDGQNVSTLASTCMMSCPPGSEPGPALHGPECCTHCYVCRRDEVSNGTLCRRCPEHHTPSDRHDSCDVMEGEHTIADGPFPLFCVAMAILGVFFVAANFCIFYSHRRKSLARSADVKLVYILLGAMLPGYFSHPLFFLTPSRAICLSRALASCMPIIVVTSVLLVRISRLARLERYAVTYVAQVRRVLSMSQSAQSLFVLLCSLAGLALLVLVTQLRPVDAVVEIIDGSPHLLCRYPVVTLLVPDAFNLLLLLVANLLAFQTRKLPTGYNLAHWIFFGSLVNLTFYLITSVPIYLASTVNRPVVFVIRVSLLMHVTWFTICYRPFKNMLCDQLHDTAGSSHVDLQTASREDSSTERPGRKVSSSLWPLFRPSIGSYDLHDQSLSPKFQSTPQHNASAVGLLPGTSAAVGNQEVQYLALPSLNEGRALCMVVHGTTAVLDTPLDIG